MMQARALASTRLSPPPGTKLCYKRRARISAPLSCFLYSFPTEPPDSSGKRLGFRTKPLRGARFARGTEVDANESFGRVTRVQLSRIIRTLSGAVSYLAVKYFT